MLERDFQSKLVKELKVWFPDCIVFKNDPTYKQGVPDLIILYKNKWATLECKRDASAPLRPNQMYYVDKMNHMSFSAFVYPQNMISVLTQLREHFEDSR